MRDIAKPILKLILLAALAVSSAAHAYIGPGAGISAIGSLLALVAAVLLAIVGFVWYPLKRLYRRFRKPAPQGVVRSTKDEDTP